MAGQNVQQANTMTSDISAFDDDFSWLDENSQDGQFSFNENDELIIGGREGDGEEEGEVEVEELEEEAPAALASPYESRITNLEAQQTKIVSLLEQVLQKGLPTQQAPAQNGEPAEETFDITDGPSLVKLIKQSVQEQIEAAIKPMRSTMQQADARMQYVDLLEQHGEEFQKSFPGVLALLKTNPSIKMADAYEVVKAIRGTTPSKPAQSDNGTQKKAVVRVDAAKLREKANNLRTPQGIRGGKVQREVSQLPDVESALNAALDEIRG